MNAILFLPVHLGFVRRLRVRVLICDYCAINYDFAEHVSSGNSQGDAVWRVFVRLRIYLYYVGGYYR